MKVHHTLICFFLTLQDVETKVFNAGRGVLTGTEGGNITVKCSFNFSGRKKFFCKEECRKQGILIETEGVRSQRGRYSIEYEEGFFPAKSTLVYVTITQLNKSDSGRYSCGLERTLGPDGYKEFKITVVDAPTISKPKSTLRPLPTSLPSSSTPTTTTQSLSSSVGSSSFSSAPETTKQPEASPGGSVVLYAGLILAFMIIVLSVTVLIFCRNRNRKSTEPPEETVYANVTKDNRVYEDIREEERRSRAPPVEMSVVYTCPKYTKPNKVETTDDYSLATATAAMSRNKTEDNSSKVTYSDVRFLNSAASSPHSAPPAHADAVVYSVPRVGMSPASQATDTSSSLYSTVALH
ncbi:uncharacterized protein [Trachinotus anak]|uniref:uncharacterized protein n=1 Tax=Trachinotus anak TaxID=443729 RepID=UPI0039F19B84